MPWKSRAPLIQARRIDQAAHCPNPIRGDAGLASMLPDCLLVRRKIDAIHLVFGNVTVEPLNLRAHLFQGLQRLEGDLSDLRLRERSGARNLAFNHKLRHGHTSLQERAATRAVDW